MVRFCMRATTVAMVAGVQLRRLSRAANPAFAGTGERERKRERENETSDREHNLGAETRRVASKPAISSASLSAAISPVESPARLQSTYYSQSCISAVCSATRRHPLSFRPRSSPSLQSSRPSLSRLLPLFHYGHPGVEKATELRSILSSRAGVALLCAGYGTDLTNVQRPAVMSPTQLEWDPRPLARDSQVPPRSRVPRTREICPTPL